MFEVGRSGVKFRETNRKAPSVAVLTATKEFPELANFGWPERGSQAELGSLLLQASRYKETQAPENLRKACDSLKRKYPKARARACLRGENWDHRDIAEEVAKICESNVNLKASPGVPLSMFGQTNGEVLGTHLEFVMWAVTQRIELLSRIDLVSSNQTPKELVEAGLCDPVRLFVKQEPHSLRKLKEGRFRLISSVSLIDQLVERLIFGPQNQLEIQRWRNIPSKPGMGLSLYEQATSIWRELQTNHDICPAAEADISGFDWSVQSWELWADVVMRTELSDFGPKLKSAAMNRFYCFMNSVFQLSDGTLIEQGLPGLMKSGSYCTSSTNSRIRCLMAELIEAPWCIAMGDDSVEGYVPHAKEKYQALGHECKDYIPCETDSSGALRKVNFCSHELSEDSFWLTSWPKTLFRFLCSPKPDVEELQAELWGCPQWTKIYNYVSIGNGRDKFNGKEQVQKQSSSCSDSRTDYSRSEQPALTKASGPAPTQETTIDELQWWGVQNGQNSQYADGVWHSLWQS
jgi:hypothetical protein